MSERYAGCSFCRINTAGNHERGCPSHPYKAAHAQVLKSERERVELEKVCAALAESERKLAKLEKAVAMSIDRRWIIEYEDYDLIGWVVYEEDGEGIVPTTPEERYEEPAAALLAAFDEAHKDGRTEENME